MFLIDYPNVLLLSYLLQFMEIFATDFLWNPLTLHQSQCNLHFKFTTKLDPEVLIVDPKLSV